MQPNLSADMIVNVLVVIFIYIWGGVEIFQQIRQRKRNRGATNDKGSLFLLYGCITLGYCICIPFGFSIYGRIEWGSPWLIVIGIVLILGGLYVRFSAMRTLASYFTFQVQIQPQQQLVQQGLYRTIRHPGYLGQLLVFFGIGLAFTNWIALIGIMLPASIGFIRRISVEEAALSAHFSAEYEMYRKSTRRLIPWIY